MGHTNNKGSSMRRSKGHLLQQVHHKEVDGDPGVTIVYAPCVENEKTPSSSLKWGRLLRHLPYDAIVFTLEYPKDCYTSFSRCTSKMRRWTALSSSYAMGPGDC